MKLKWPKNVGVVEKKLIFPNLGRDLKHYKADST